MSNLGYFLRHDSCVTKFPMTVSDISGLLCWGFHLLRESREETMMHVELCQGFPVHKLESCQKPLTSTLSPPYNVNSTTHSHTHTVTTSIIYENTRFRKLCSLFSFSVTVVWNISCLENSHWNKSLVLRMKRLKWFTNNVLVDLALLYWNWYWNSSRNAPNIHVICTSHLVHHSARD